MISTIYLHNENGLLPQKNLPDFCLNFQKETSLNFDIVSLEQIASPTTIFKKYVMTDLEFVIYEHGYVMKIEGEARKLITLLIDVDRCLEDHLVLFVSPIQAIENKEDQRYPRGSSEQIVAKFLDRLFRNSFYSTALEKST